MILTRRLNCYDTNNYIRHCKNKSIPPRNVKKSKNLSLLDVNSPITGFRSSAASTTQLGRGIRRLVSLFDDVADLVHHMDKHAAHLGGMEDEDDMELTDKSPDEISDLKRQ